MRVKLSSMPNPKTVDAVTLTGLSGGLNLRDDPTKVGNRQSPDMKNMWYRDGALRKRYGQEQVFPEAGNHDGRVWFYDRLFHGLIVYVQGTVIRYFDPDIVGEDKYVPKTVSGTKIPAGTGHGCFFAFDECLYYKARGVYLRLRYASGALTAENLLWQEDGGYQCENTYLPVIAINRRADGSGGDTYQPENRINPRKAVWFDIDKESHEYFLPVNGCTVESVQLGDDKLTLQEHTAPGGTYSINGHQFTVVNQADGAALKTSLKWTEPLYIDEAGWTGKDWTEQESKGWNYLKNVVYSNFPLEVTEETELSGGKIVRFGERDEQKIPQELSEVFLMHAKSLCAYEDAVEHYFILDDGATTMNFFFLRPTSYENGKFCNIAKYDTDNKEIWVKDYFLVSYSRVSGLWTTQDFSGRTDNGWHYVYNCVFNMDLTNVYCKKTDIDGSVTYQLIIYMQTPTLTKSNMAHSSLMQTADGFCTSDGGVFNSKLLWIAENERVWTFHYLINGGRFDMTMYDSEQGWFQGKGIRMVTLPKRGALNNSTVKVEDMTEPGEWGYYVKNIVWAAEDLCYYGVFPGDAAMKKTETALPDIYKKYVETALYRARRDYPDANITGKYAVSVQEPYVTVYIDTGMELTEYDVKTGEFKATGWISEGYTMDDAYSDPSIQLSAPEAMSNQLRVVYKKDNPEAMKAIGDCWAATDFGGSDAVTVVMGGCDGQPNAIFWSGNGSAGVDATYFPMDQYNLCGAYQDPVTGFGKQQSALIVFQNHHTTKAGYGITEISGRKYIDLSLATINAEKGCDRPWSICLCGNNLCWMHSKYGVLYLKDTSSAYENQIVVISEHVNGNALRPGLLKDLAEAESGECVGADDGQRYYGFVGKSLYVWDYSLGTVGQGLSGLSWTRHGDFSVQGAMEGDTGSLWLISKQGRIARMKESLDSDFGEKIRCHYRTPTLDFGGYYRRRNVEQVVLTLGKSREEPVDIFYGGEGQMYRHPAPGFAMEKTAGDWVPMVLRPRGLRLHHFFLQVESEGPLALSEVLVLYTSGGKTK